MRFILYFLIFFLTSSCRTIDINKQLAVGLRQYEADSLKQSIKTFSEIISSTDTCGKCFLYRGFAYKALNDNFSALKDFNSLIAIDTSQAAGYANRGSVYYMQNDYYSALRDFKKALQLDKSTKVLYNPISHMLFATGQKDEACIYYKKALEFGDTAFDKSIIEYCEMRNCR
jgi:tetratricopeptide (TPR) repeat protein